MALFAVSFVLEDGSDYNDRYAQLTKAIAEVADGEVWSEMPSLFLLTSTKNSVGLKEEILASVAVQDGDVMLVINLSKTKGHATQGVKRKMLFKKLIEQR